MYKRVTSTGQVKELPSDSGRSLSYNLPIRSKMAAIKKQCFFFLFVFCIELNIHLPPSKVRGLQMTINFALVLINVCSRQSNLNFAYRFVIYWLLQNAAKKNQLRSHTKEKPYMINSYFANLVRQKRSIVWAKYVYVCKWDMCWRNFYVFCLET